jgi:aspartate racemase
MPSCSPINEGAEIPIAGCTELSLGFASIATVPLPWVDPLDVLASITLDLAFGRYRLENSLS